MRDRTPDVIGEVVAFRAWLVTAGPTLVSMNGTEWFADGWFHATCDRCDDIPGARCSCGIYAAIDATHLYGLGHYHDAGGEDQLTVVGEVGLAGKVIPGSQGYRAEKARAIRLYVPFAAWEVGVALARRYRCSSELANTLQPIVVDGEAA